MKAHTESARRAAKYLDKGIVLPSADEDEIVCMGYTLATDECHLIALTQDSDREIGLELPAAA